MKSNNCPRCFGPRPADALYAGSLCPRCSAEVERDRFARMTPDDVAAELRAGTMMADDAERYCAAWNASGKHFSTACVRFGRVVLLDY